MSTQIQIRRDTTANWEDVNPTLADGEIGYDTTANKFKVGNGTDAWVDIEYSGASGTELVDGEAYIRLEDGSWVASPSMKFEGDLTVNGNITIDGGQIVDPDGNSAGGSPVHIGDTAPSNPAEGDLWYDTDSDTMFLFDGTEWFSTESCGSGGYDDTQIFADLAQEVADREAGDLALQGQIDALGSGGGSEWDLLHRADLAGVTMLDYPDIFTDDHITYRVELREIYSIDGINLQGKVYNEGALLSSGYLRTTFDPINQFLYAGSLNALRFDSQSGPVKEGDLEITIVHARPRLLPNPQKQPRIGFNSVLHKVGSQKTREVVVNNCLMQTDWGDWNGFQIYTSTNQFDAGTALIYGLRRE